MAKPINSLSDAIRAFNKDPKNKEASSYIRNAFDGRSGIFVKDDGKIDLDATLEAYDTLEEAKIQKLPDAVSFDELLAQSRPERRADPVVRRMLFNGKTVDADPEIDWSSVSDDGRKAAAFAVEMGMIQETDDASRLAAYHFGQDNPPPPYSTAIAGYRKLMDKTRKSAEDLVRIAQIESRLVFDPTNKVSTDPDLQKLLVLGLPKAPIISSDDRRLQPSGGNQRKEFLQVHEWAPLLSREQCIAVATYLVGPGCRLPDAVYHAVRSAYAGVLWSIVGDAGNGPKPTERFQNLLSVLK
ncbi:MAG TPA: hypothetical protein VLK22_01750 [Candidatus Udaeobacter sp.]|nr:hypothetical protein [Candidatus Udaeobacter sp.]